MCACSRTLPGHQPRTLGSGKDFWGRQGTECLSLWINRGLADHQVGRWRFALGSCKGRLTRWVGCFTQVASRRGSCSSLALLHLLTNATVVIMSDSDQECARQYVPMAGHLGQWCTRWQPPPVPGLSRFEAPHTNIHLPPWRASWLPRCWSAASRRQHAANSPSIRN